jgi:FkbM family methyltransferase
MRENIRDLLGSWYTPRLRHVKRQLEIKYLNKGEPEIALLPKILSKTEISLDVGANIGDYLDTFASNSRRVIAFEPHTRCFARLSSAGVRNCTLVNVALSNRSGTATLRVPVESGELPALGTIEVGNTSLEANARELRSYEIQVARLDDLIDRYVAAGEVIGFVKIDVEGHEHAVVEGATATIDRHRPVVMIETEYRHSDRVRDLFALFVRRGYASKALVRGSLEPIDADGLAALQRDVSLGDVVKDAKDSPYVNNVWFIPPERADALRVLGRS